MHIAFTDDQDALRKELRGYFSELMTPDVQEASPMFAGGRMTATCPTGAG
jgi:hypothetical protein